MKNFAKTTILGLLSIQNLLSTTTYAFDSSTTNQDKNIAHFKEGPFSQYQYAERIIQKRVVGFDPKQAVNTLSFLKEMGIGQFETDGSVIVPQSMLPDITAVSETEELNIRILAVKDDLIKVKFAAPNIDKFDRSKLEAAKELAQFYQLKCDMDGKMNGF